MGAFGVVVFEIFPHQIFKVPLPEDEEMIHTFPFYGSHEAFGVRIKFKSEN
jgi:hypothetical protein